MISRRQFSLMALMGLPFVSFSHQAERLNFDPRMSRKNKTGNDLSESCGQSRLGGAKKAANIALLGFGGSGHLPSRKVQGGGYGIKVKEAELLLDYAYAHGVNYFDTGYFYLSGESEMFFGGALKKYPRDTFYLCDKMPTRTIKSLEHAKSIFEEQLNKCQVDYFDVYLLHGVAIEDEYYKVYEEYGVLNYLKEQKNRGRIKKLGFSFHGSVDFLKKLVSLEEWDVVQLQINAYAWDGPDQMRIKYALCEERGLPVIVMSPLSGGRLAKLTDGANSELRKINPGDSAAKWAFRFAASHKNVVSVLSAPSCKEHLKENINTFFPVFKPLSECEVSEYRRVMRGELAGRLGVPCTGCRYCDPCPQGIDIAAVFAWWNELVNNHRTPDVASGWRGKYHDWRFLRSYETRILGNSRVERCTSCHRCNAKCPQGEFKVRDEIMAIRSVIAEARKRMPDFSADNLFYRMIDKVSQIRS